MRRFAAALKHHSVMAVLKSLYPDIMAFGGALSGHLCKAGHHTQLSLLPNRFAGDIAAVVERYR